MPITSIYNIGTVNTVKGSDLITGVGTNWIGAALREGDQFWCEGLIVRVLALVDNTSLRLAHPWPGTTGNAKDYEIQYVPETTRVLGQTTELLNMLSTGAIDPLKELIPAADRVAVYTGEHTARMAVITAFAQTILDSADAASVRSKLGITYQTSRYDKTSNRNLRTGSFGLGATTVANITNINDTTMPTSFATVATATVQGTLPPEVGTTDALLVIRISGNSGFQIYFPNIAAAPIFYRRATSSTTWSAWKKIMFE